MGEATSRNQALGISPLGALPCEIGLDGRALTAVTALRFPLRFLDAAKAGKAGRDFLISELELDRKRDVTGCDGGGLARGGSLPLPRDLRAFDAFIMASSRLMIKESEVVEMTRLVFPSSAPSTFGLHSVSTF